MALLCILIYIFLISAAGCFFLRRSKIDPVLIFPSGFMIGSVIMGAGMLFLVTIRRVSVIPVFILIALMSVLGSLGISTLLNSLREAKQFLCSHFYVGRYKKLLLILLIFGLAVYLADSYAPPRSGDAMRYHLAQIKDTVRHDGFVFRPYYHYNFPQYFHYLFIPVYMAVGGVGVQLGVYFYFILVVFLASYLCFKTKQSNQLLLIVVFLTFTPLITRESTTLNNDLAVVFYLLLGLLLIIEFETASEKSWLVLAYLSLGFALGCKYHAVLYLPIYLLFTFFIIKRHRKLLIKDYATIISLVLFFFLIASPFFIRNFLYTGDPVWPLLQDLFRVKKNYLYHVTQAYNQSQQGQLRPAVLINSIVTLVTTPFVIPVMWILLIGYYFARLPFGRLYKVTALLYFCLWFLLQPKIYDRFVIFILPVITVMAIGFCKWFYEKYHRLGKLPYALVILSIAGGIAFSVFYSLDFLKYQVTRDLKEYHQSTWFYEQYQWINQNLNDDGKVLVIVTSGHTYYLNKEYLRADPWLSGLIDWPSIRDVEELKEILNKLQIRYIFYEDRNWSRELGGSNMMRLMEALKGEDGVSILLKDDKVKLVTLRMLNRHYFTKVFLIDLQAK